MTKPTNVREVAELLRDSVGYIDVARDHPIEDWEEVVLGVMGALGDTSAVVRVSGSCKDGHVTEAETEPGRLTWSGTCSTAGCGASVTGRWV